MLREEPSSSTGRAAASKQVAAARTKRMSSAVAAAVRRLWKPLIAVVSGGRTEKREWNGWEGKEEQCVWGATCWGERCASIVLSYIIYTYTAGVE
jgi:hypothetical protein